MSAERGERLSLLAVHNKTLLLEQTAKRAHERVDELKAQYSKDQATFQAAVDKEFADIQTGIATIGTALQDLRDWKNRALGWAGAAIFLSSIMGATIATGILKMMTFPSSPAAAEHNVGPPKK